MFATIVVLPLPSGEFLARAPDLGDLSLADGNAGNAFARIRLAVEGALADRLLAGEGPPPRRPLDEWRRDPTFADGRWYEVHINLGHLEAVARHQRARAGA